MTVHSFGKNILYTLTALVLTGCQSVEIKSNIVRGATYVPFATVGDWHIYGVSGATQSRRFIKSQKVPSNYPYTDVCATGFGGILLVYTNYNEYLAFDLSCPVEHSTKTLVYVDNETFYAKCPVCGSTYDIFFTPTAPGYPMSGPARTDGYGLTIYRVAFGVDGNYALITQ